MPLSLGFFGAAGEVSGSSTYVESGSARVLVDFGMHQGSAVSEARNRRLPPIDASRLDAVVLTHAHIDHCGRLPMLTKSAKEGCCGYNGPIYATPATIELAAILLEDSAYLQEMDAQRRTRYRQRGGRATPAAPLYTARDVEIAVMRMKPVEYDNELEIAPGVRITLVDAGHIMGSASVLMRVKPKSSAEKTIAFSGDIGTPGSPLLRDPVRFDAADIVLMESTYGDRDHRPLEQTLAEFETILRSAQDARGKILIPAFAVGRTQSLIYHIGMMKRSKRLDGTPVYVDSPMALEATELYARHRRCFDEAALAMIDRGDSPLTFPGLHAVRSAEESRRLNELDCCAIIISASGMCNGGRILHHLRHSLWKPQTHVVIVGFQSHGTLGRQLVDGAKRVTIMHEPVAVKATIHTLGGFSAHAGKSDLLRWIEPMMRSKPKVFLNHGEAQAREALSREIGTRWNNPAELPNYQAWTKID